MKIKDTISISELLWGVAFLSTFLISGAPVTAVQSHSRFSLILASSP